MVGRCSCTEDCPCIGWPTISFVSNLLSDLTTDAVAFFSVYTQKITITVDVRRVVIQNEIYHHQIDNSIPQFFSLSSHSNGTQKYMIIMKFIVVVRRRFFVGLPCVRRFESRRATFSSDKRHVWLLRLQMENRNCV